MTYAFAHRGGRAHGPDNTLPTFQQALAEGATALETDAWVTADGIVVLDHDGLHLAGTADEKPITEVSRGELAGHIPTLANLYETCGTGFELAIDVKGGGAGAQVIREVAQAHGAAARLWLFTPSRTRPGDVAPAHAGVTVRRDELWGGRRRRRLLQELRNDGVDVVNARWPLWHRSAVADVHQHEMLAFAWDVQSRLGLWRARRLAIDGIFSDRLHTLRAFSG